MSITALREIARIALDASLTGERELTRLQKEREQTEAQLAQAKEKLASAEEQLQELKAEVKTEVGEWLARVSLNSDAPLVEAWEDEDYELMSKHINEMLAAFNEAHCGAPYSYERRMIAIEEELTLAVREQLRQQKERLAELELQRAQLTRVTMARVDGIQSAIPPEGKVIHSYSDWGFVILDLGMENGVSQGTNLQAYRGDQLVGQLQVSEVFLDHAVADVKATVERGHAPQVGDRVSFAQ